MKTINKKFGYNNKCQICNSKNINEILNLGSSGLCDSLLTKKDLLKKNEKSYPLKLVRCVNCQLLQLNYIVNNKKVFHKNYPYKSGITKKLKSLLYSTSNYVINNYKFKKKPLAIDIGSNDGTLLEGFKKNKFNVIGIEPTNIAKIANKKKIKTFQTFFDSNSARLIKNKIKKEANVITGTNIFAHINKLDSFLKGVINLLDKEDGIFITESHYTVDIIDDLQYDSIYHEHLRFYLLYPLKVLLESYNFKVIDAIRIPNYGGSIRVVATLNHKIKAKKSVNKLLNYEKKNKFYTANKYKIFSKNVYKTKNILLKLLNKIKKKNQKIVGIGCPGRSITLLAFCGINNKLIDYIAEQSSSLKLNYFTPNSHVQIIDEKKFFKDNPEYALILSWHYKDSIMKNLRNKGYKGKFIIPLPYPKVIS